MDLKTTALRIYGSNDLRVETFDLPEPGPDEILAEVVSNSICMSSHKAADLGAAHKRVPDDVAENPTIIGHEFAGRILHVGQDWADRFQVGQMFAVQPALSYKGSTDAPGYSFRWIGGNATRVLIPNEVMLMDCLLPYEGDAFFKASLAEPMSCIVGAFRAQYHWAPGSYEHLMGIREGGNCALLACAGPMGLGAIDLALHGERRPARIVVTDIDQTKLDRAAELFPPAAAAADGIELVYLNPAALGDMDALVAWARDFTGGARSHRPRMFDDAFVFVPVGVVVEQADAILGRNGCLNFFAGPTRKDFAAPFNFYGVHYEEHHIVGTSGGNTEDMRIALEMMGAGTINPAGMVTHVGGLDAAAQTILDLPDIPGGKKLVYTHVEMPLTALDALGAAADEADGKRADALRELDRLVRAAGGLWSTEAEKFLLAEMSRE
jgi:L-sorbose 1-phosphate reductase